MMRLIDADELLKFKRDVYDYEGHPIYAVPTGIIMHIPTVDAVPVLHGVWYKGPDSVIECSECHWFGKIDGYEYVYNFCPHCGAKMEVKDDDDQ